MTTISHLFDLLMLVGAAVLAVVAYRMGRGRSPHKPPDAVLIDSVREDIANDTKTQQNAIQDAVTGENPAAALADLGNRRRQ